MAVVTGSSTGIGRAMAVKLAERGFDVIVHAARNVSDAETVQKQIVEDLQIL